MIYGVLVMALVGVLWAFAFLHAAGAKQSAKALSVSNARVLREYKRMALYHPEKIIECDW